MNTTAVGDALESAVYDYFAREIEEGRFWTRSECVRLHRKKEYYSRDRQGNIVFDLAIEVFMPGVEDYSLLYLIECKNYGRPVEVGDVEVFLSRVQQVAGGGAKGVVASASSFQRSAFEFARSNRIGVLRCFEPSEFKWDLPRSPSAYGAWAPPRQEWPEIERALTQERFVSTIYDFYGSDGSTYTNSVNALLSALAEREKDLAWRSVLKTVINDRAQKLQLVDFVSDEEIEERVEEVLRGVGYDGGAVSLEAICEHESRECGLTLVMGAERTEKEAARGVLGRIRFDPLEVVLFETGEGSVPRRRFTLAHELGHHFMGHRRYMIGEYVEGADLADEYRPPLAPQGIRRLEAQANRFASNLLMPKETFGIDALVVAQELGLNDKGHGLIYVDDQECNRRAFYGITDQLRLKYDVSREAVRLRLDHLGLLNDARRGTHLGSPLVPLKV